MVDSIKDDQLGVDNERSKNCDTSGSQQRDGDAHSQQNVLRSEVVLVRGRIRRVWRKRFLELTDDGILKYFDAEKDGGNTIAAIPTTPVRVAPAPHSSTAQIGEKNYDTRESILPPPRSGEPVRKDDAPLVSKTSNDNISVDREWCDVSEACYPEHSSKDSAVSAPDRSDEESLKDREIISIDPDKERPVNSPEALGVQEVKPRAILLVLRARLLDTSSFKDGKSGLPAKKWGFLFHGHILYYEAHLGNGTSDHQIPDVDVEHGVLEGHAALEKTMHNPFSSRPFHVAVDSQRDAVEWVRALQRVAVATSCGLTPEMPPRYATIDENYSVENESKHIHNNGIGSSNRAKWATSLFDPLKISVSSNDLRHMESRECVRDGPIHNGSETDEPRNGSAGTETHRQGEASSLSPTGSQNVKEKWFFSSSLSSLSTSFERARRYFLPESSQGNEQIPNKFPYWCALGLAMSFGGCLGVMIAKRSVCGISSSATKASGGAVSILPSGRGAGVSIANGGEATSMQVRVELVALSFAFALACGYKLGHHACACKKQHHLTETHKAARKVAEGNVMRQSKENDSGSNVVKKCKTNERNSPQGAVAHEKGEGLSSPLPKFPGNSGRSCWSEPAPSMFKVRGQSYLSDRIKVASGPAIFKCRGVDIWLTEDPRSNIARHPAVLGGDLFRKNCDIGGKEEDTFLINFLLPFGNFVAYFDVPSKDVMPPQVAQVWSDFCSGDQQYRDARLKLLPVVVEGPWVVKTVVGNGSSPALLGKAVPLQYYFTPPKKGTTTGDTDGDGESDSNSNPSDAKENGIYEVDVIISASNIAKGILNIVKGHTKYLTIAFALIIEAASETELPENVLCTFGVHSIDLDQCPCLDDFNDSLGEEDMMDT
jgi:hypothetical protein